MPYPFCAPGRGWRSPFGLRWVPLASGRTEQVPVAVEAGFTYYLVSFDQLGLMFKHSRAPLIAVAPIMLWAVPTQDKVTAGLAPVSDFRELPVVIAQDLAKRGCKIPQIEGLSERHNVVQGRFARRGQRDWAALCLQGSTSRILVYWNGSARSPAQLAPMDETMTSSKSGYYRILQVVDEKFIRDHFMSGRGGVAPPPTPPSIIDHDGIDDGIYGKGSSVHYFYEGEWMKLAGS